MFDARINHSGLKSSFIPIGKFKYARIFAVYFGSLVKVNQIGQV
ncbi:hypothetical protein SCB49_08558 [unidentified eubacterium SCB49]|nr:hypothetical protein SCB49_08558 [unidentified eubacterium SCB49]